jgi:hypothetical protein
VAEIIATTVGKRETADRTFAGDLPLPIVAIIPTSADHKKATGSTKLSFLFCFIEQPELSCIETRNAGTRRF